MELIYYQRHRIAERTELTHILRHVEQCLICNMPLVEFNDTVTVNITVITIMALFHCPLTKGLGYFAWIWRILDIETRLGCAVESVVSQNLKKYFWFSEEN